MIGQNKGKKKHTHLFSKMRPKYTQECFVIMNKLEKSTYYSFFLIAYTLDYEVPVAMTVNDTNLQANKLTNIHTLDQWEC